MKYLPYSPEYLPEALSKFQLPHVDHVPEFIQFLFLTRFQKAKLLALRKYVLLASYTYELSYLSSIYTDISYFSPLVESFSFNFTCGA